MLSAARCDACNASIPLRGSVASFALPPAVVACPGCGKTVETILLFRATWMEALVWKCLALVSVPLAVVLALRHPSPWWWLLGTLVLGGVLGGFVLSRVLAFPLTVLTDKVRKIEKQ